MVTGQPESVINKPKDLHWTPNNIMTLLSWISIATYNIDCLELAIARYREWMRQHVILGLVLSTISGTLSVTQFGSINSQNVNFILNFFFTIFTFTVAISTGCIKVYQVQERLEKFITVKQEWIVFITKIATQFQLNIDLRKDALDLINVNKDKYLDLLKIDNEIPDFIKKQVKDKFIYKKNRVYFKDFHPSLEIGEAMSISDIIMNIGYVEGKNLSHLEQEQRERRERLEKTVYKEKAADKVDKQKRDKEFGDNIIIKKINSSTNIYDLDKNVIYNNNNNYFYDVESDDIEVNQYYEENYRNCISRRPSIDESQVVAGGGGESKKEDKLFNNIVSSLPSFFIKDREDKNLSFLTLDNSNNKV